MAMLVVRVMVAVAVMLGALGPRHATAADMQPGVTTAGAGLGLMGATPDGTAFTLNAHGEQFIYPNVSVGPLVQLAFTGDLFLLGISGQVKHWTEVANTAGRLRVCFQGGFGFVHANVLESDNSWLIPLGAGLDYAISPRQAVTADLLLNFTHLENTRQHDAHVMPTFTVGFRF